MKRFLLILLLFSFLFVSGCGAPKDTPHGGQAPSGGEAAPGSLKEQLGAPAHVEGEFSSESGISTVKVNAEVFVPEASGADMIRVSPRIFTQKEIDTMVNRYEGSLPWTYATDSQGDKKAGQAYEGGGPEPDNRDSDSEQVKSYGLWINAGEYTGDPDVPEEEEYRSLFVDYDLNSSTGALADSPEMGFSQGFYGFGLADTNEIAPLTDGRAEGCSISPEEAIAFAEEEVEALAPEYRLFECGQLPVYKMLGNPRYYILRFTRQIDGIPVNGTYHTQAGNAYAFVSGTSEIHVVVRDSGVFALNYSNPEDPGEVTAENVKLLPFSEIWDIFSRVGLLSIQSLEAEQDVQVNRITITEIRFGYMKVWQPDGSYLYTPVWDFYGTRFLAGTGAYAHAADTGESFKDSLLTLNAMDGTVIDRDLGY